MYTLKKSLGQHFLKDENICRKIIQALQEHPFKRLVEVGPGGAALTSHLLQIEGIDFKAVELDKEKVEWLIANFPAITEKIIHQDFLTIDRPFNAPFTVIGNFPYNISTQILFKILDWREYVDAVIGMFQKEVAQRIASKEGNKTYGVISVLMQAFFNIEYLFEVSEGSFQPPPKVKSAVIRLLPAKEKLRMRTEKDFFLLVKTAFNQRRKTLRNAVKGLFDQQDLADPVFNLRAEQLKVTDFAALTFRMKPAQGAGIAPASPDKAGTPLSSSTI